MASKPAASWLLLLAAVAVPGVLSDGIGIIGFGKTMYQPPCAFACRAVVAKCRLSCSPPPPPPEAAAAGAKPAKTPASCYVTDPPFMQTVALCIATYCPSSDGETASPRVIEEYYWPSHLPSTGVADFSLTPAMSYPEALANARRDERRSDEEAAAAGSNRTAGHGHAGHDGHGSHMLRRSRSDSDSHGLASLPVRILARHGGHGDEEEDTTPVNTTLPVLKSGTTLNTTSFVRQSDWQKQYKSLVNFEAGEIGHSKYTIVITVVPFILVILAALPRLVPALNRSRSWAWLKSLTVSPPLWGTRHRKSLVFGAGYMPTRGQSLLIFVMVALNVAALAVPHSPPAGPPAPSPAILRAFEISAVGCRAGMLAMGNAVVLVVLAGRNLLPLPARLAGFSIWSHDAQLLLHRIFGYLAVAHTIIHSVLMLVSYVEAGSYAVESPKPYWIWGAVGAVAAAAIVPASLLAVRRRFYEAFLAVHRLLAVLFFLGYFLHIFYRFSFKWGYEIWCYIAVGLWAFERLLRLVRVAVARVRAGRRAEARVALVPGSAGEYLRIDIDRLRARRGGHVYLYFPTLGWQFWENHPFSIAWSSSSPSPPPMLASPPKLAPTDNDSFSADSSDEKPTRRERDEPGVFVAETQAKEAAANPPSPPAASDNRDRVSILVRVHSGMTARLAARVTSARGNSGGDNHIRIPVLVEGPYHTAPASKQLAQCSSIVCIAGGVGVSAVLPVLLLSLSSAGERRRVRLCWGVRSRCLVDECEPEMIQQLRAAGARVEISVGSRLDIPAILRQELLLADTGTAAETGPGPVGVVVCGPPAMADEVRSQTTRLARSGTLPRGVVLVDEAFTW